MLRLLTTADTEILAAAHARQAARRRLPGGPGARTRRRCEDLDAFVDGAQRRRRPPARRPPRLAGGRASSRSLRARRHRLILLGGEAEPDAELARAQPRPRRRRRPGLRVPAPRRRRQHARAAHASSPTRSALTGHGFEPPQRARGRRLLPRRNPEPDGRPRVGVVFYRSHFVTGNTAFIDALAQAIEARRRPARLPVGLLAPRRRPRAEAARRRRRRADHHRARVAAARHAGDEWHAEALEALGVPVIQALCATTTRQRWAESDSGLTPLDAAMQVAIPEFDGRIIGVPISFKEPIADLPFEALHYAPDHERCAGLAQPRGQPRAAADAGPQPSSAPRSSSRSFPTKHARVGNAVGLDTPASAMVLLEALQTGRPPRRARLRARRRAHPRPDRRRRPRPGVPHRHAAAPGAPRGSPIADYAEWFNTLPDELHAAGDRRPGARPPGEWYVDGDDFVIAGLDLGNVFVAIQPPRGYGENPVAIYHDPQLAPAHHYLATYRWLTQQRRRDRPPRQARHARVAAGQGARAEQRLRARRLPRRHAALLPLRGQRPRRGHAGQAPRPRRRDRPPRPADDARRDLRRAGPARAAARRLRARRGAGPREAPHARQPHLDPDPRGRAAPRPPPRGRRSPTSTTSAR